MDEPIESYNQAQRATTILNTVSSHPAEHINFFTARPPNSVYSTSTSASAASGVAAGGERQAYPNTMIMPKAVLSSPPQESEKLTKMKNRQFRKQVRQKMKNVKQGYVTEGVTDEYNIENILEELGENESSKKSSNSKTKKPKAERKRSGKLSVSGSGKKDLKETDDKELEANTSTTEDEDDDDEEIDKAQSPVILDQDQISSTNQMPPPQATAMLNRQASRSTEDMFTPVVKKHSKWKNKKACMLSKDDSTVNTYSSSSSASSTTSSSAVQAPYASTHSSTLSAKPNKYNLRGRKSALRPSQSFDTMKSGSCSVASDDSSSTAKDRLDLATDFPPLSAGSEVGVAPVSNFVPQWVLSKSAYLVGAAEKVLNNGRTENNQSTAAAATTTPNQNFQNNSEISDENKNNNDNPNTSSSLSFSTSAVIHEASDQATIQNPLPSEVTTKTGSFETQPTTNKKMPPPDVTVVPLQNNVIITSQKRTANAVMLPDIAAQAPNVMMNTTNSSSGVSSNAGDLTPPQTALMSEPSSFYHQLDDNEPSSSGDLCPPEVEFPEEAEATDHPSSGTGNIEFGFEVNVLDLINQKNQQHLASDDEAIVSFGNTINVFPVQQVQEPEIAVEFHQEENYEDDTAADDHGADHTGSDPYSVTGNENSAVKTIPNYAQIVQYMAKSWRNTEQELEKGIAQVYKPLH